MLRAAAWTGGLFALGAGIVGLFPGPWVEPAVLAALGAALIVAGGRRADSARHDGTGAAPGLEPVERAAR
jgi:hypothetical protein